jgi:hypothetical protein
MLTLCQWEAKERKRLHPRASHTRPSLPRANYMKLSKFNIYQISLPTGEREIIGFDDDFPGFGLRVRGGGSRNCIFQHRHNVFCLSA